jgi:hypothetical protein
MRAALLLMLLLLIPAALGLGVSPARIVLQPTDTDFTFRTIPSQGEEGTIAVRAEGDLADRITFTKTVLVPGEAIEGKIDIPSDLSPGSHNQNIVITLNQGGAGTVGGRAEVAGSLVVQVPYPEEYLVADWSVDRDGDTALITVTIQNLGSRITTPEVTVTISDGSAGDIVTFDETPVVPASFSKVESTYNLGARRPGVYTAQLLVEYAGERITQSREEAFGEPTLSLDQVRYRNEAGAIKPIDISGRLGWNRPVDITAIVYIDGNSEPALKGVFTAEEEFEHRLYLDTAVTGVPQQSIRIVIIAAGAEASQVQPLGMQAEEQSTWWIPVVAALTVLAVVLGLFWRRKTQTL